MNDLSRFQQAIAARQKERADEASKGIGTGLSQYPEIPWTALVTDEDIVVRLLGNPPLGQRDPTDCKSVWYAMLLGDSGKKFRCIAPSPKEDRNWILHRVISLVMSYKWDSSLTGPDGRPGVRVYDNAKSHPDIFNRVAKNSSDSPYEIGWKFTQSDIWNIIDRQNMQWHRDNRQCRLLSKRGAESGGRMWYDLGVPHTLYSQLIDDIVSMDGNTDWSRYDVVIRKVKERPWYKVMHGIDDIKRINENARQYIVNGDLTEEEKSWQMHNLDELFPVTTYKRIQDNLGLFFQQIDKAFNKHFYDELVSLVEEEAKTNPLVQAQAEPTVSVTVPTPPQPVEPQPQVRVSIPIRNVQNVRLASEALQVREAIATPPTPVEEPVPDWVQPSTPVQAVAPIPMTPEVWSKLADGSLTGRQYLGVPLMTEGEKSLATGFDASTGTIVWDVNRAGKMAVDAQSNFEAPEIIHVDPLSGKLYQATASI